MAPVTKESAAFAFRGTVKQRGAANLKAITDTARTAVVTVDEIVRSPPALAGFVGHDVTVQLAANEQVRNGERVSSTSPALSSGRPLLSNRSAMTPFRLLNRWSRPA